MSPAANVTTCSALFQDKVDGFVLQTRSVNLRIVCHGCPHDRRMHPKVMSPAANVTTCEALFQPKVDGCVLQTRFVNSRIVCECESHGCPHCRRMHPKVMSESGPLRAVHLSRHKWLGGLVNPLQT